MIKNIPYICLLLLFACGCEQKESFEYTDRDALYFMLPKEAGEPWTEGKPKALERTCSFVTFVEKEGELINGWIPRVKADTLTTDTVKQIRIAVAGTLSNMARDYRLKTLEADSAQSTVSIQYAEAYNISPNSLNDTISFVVFAPTEGNTSIGYVTFDTSKSPLFPSTITGWDKLKITSIFYQKPKEWNNDIYGPFSQEKYAFMVEVLETEYEYYESISNWDESNMPDYCLPRLKESLKKYNEEHPESPKDFTFPGME